MLLRRVWQHWSSECLCNLGPLYCTTHSVRRQKWRHSSRLSPWINWRRHKTTWRNNRAGEKTTRKNTNKAVTVRKKVAFLLSRVFVNIRLLWNLKSALSSRVLCAYFSVSLQFSSLPSLSSTWENEVCRAKRKDDSTKMHRAHDFSNGFWIEKKIRQKKLLWTH